jgi:transcription initiation factor TFIIIB Brf1 subunit/transcription initiation factor TFIIB
VLRDDDEVACPKCGGDAFVSYDEDGRRVRDACYACGNTGRVSAQEAFDREVESLARAIGVQRAQEVEARSEEFGLQAAESMLSLRDYRDLLATDYESEARDALMALPDWMRRALIRSVEGAGYRAPIAAAKPVPTAPEPRPIEGELPF